MTSVYAVDRGGPCKGVRFGLEEKGIIRYIDKLMLVRCGTARRGLVLATHPKLVNTPSSKDHTEPA